MSPSEEHDYRPGLSPPRFHLSTLMWIMAAFCVVFAIMGAVGPIAALVIALLLLSIGAHVAGTSLGKQLRDNGQPHDRRQPEANRVTTEVDEEDFAPQSSLSVRSSLGALIFIFTVVGAMLGASVGGVALTVLYWDSIRWPSVVVAVVASGVLGGFVGFLASSFVRVAYTAQAEAWRESRR